MKLLIGIGLLTLLLIGIIVIKHALYGIIHRQEQKKSEELP